MALPTWPAPSTTIRMSAQAYASAESRRSAHAFSV